MAKPEVLHRALWDMPLETKRFDGPDVTTADAIRLTGQLEKVKTLMSDGEFRTLEQIASAVNGSEAGVSARLRDLRKVRFGGLSVERKRVEGGLWMYRVTAPLCVSNGSLPETKAQV